MGSAAAVEFFGQLDVASCGPVLVALGGRLDGDTLLAAYRAGCFPWPNSGPDRATLNRQARRLVAAGRVRAVPGEQTAGPLPWCSPDPRAVLLTDRLRVSRSLRRTLGHSGWHTTMDLAFAEVLEGCADRDSTWITPAMQEAYQDLHERGAAHSLEVWEGDRLVGGLYGVLTGAVFSGESMFHRVADASKVALVDLCRRLLEAGVLLLDTQQPTGHLASLGQVVVPRREYLAAVQALRDRPTVLPTGARTVGSVLAPDEDQATVVG